MTTSDAGRDNFRGQPRSNGTHDNPEAGITLGADKGYDAAEFIDELKRLKVKSHVAQNKSGRRSEVPDEIA